MKKPSCAVVHRIKACNKKELRGGGKTYVLVIPVNYLMFVECAYYSIVNIYNPK